MLTRFYSGFSSVGVSPLISQVEAQLLETGELLLSHSTEGAIATLTASSLARISSLIPTSAVIGPVLCLIAAAVHNMVLVIVMWVPTQVLSNRPIGWSTRLRFISCEWVRLGDRSSGVLVIESPPYLKSIYYAASVLNRNCVCFEMCNVTPFESSCKGLLVHTSDVTLPMRRIYSDASHTEPMKMRCATKLL